MANKRSNRWLAAGAACAATVALAQAPTTYDGKWKAEYTARNGVARDGTVVIADRGGRWQMDVQQRNNPCAGREAPIAVTEATETTLRFVIQRSAVLTGCKDGNAQLQRVDDRTLTGEFDGMALRLVRE